MFFIIHSEEILMKKISTIMIIGIAVLYLVGAFICIFFAPMSFGLYSQSHEYLKPINYVQLYSCWSCSLPCFVLLAFMLNISKKIRLGTFFSSSSAKILFVGGLMLAIDSLIYMGLNIFFSIYLKSMGIQALFAVISLIGIAIGVSLIVLSKAVIESARYKESGEGIL